MLSLVWFAIGLGLGASWHLWWRWRSRNQVSRLLERLGVDSPRQGDRNDVVEQGLLLVLDRMRQQEDRLLGMSLRVRDIEQLLERLPVGFIRVDRHNTVLDCNPCASLLLGIDDWQPSRKALLEWVRSYELDRLVLDTRSQADRSQPLPTIHSHDWLFYPSGGDSRPVPLRAKAVPLSNGNVGVFLEDRGEAFKIEQQRNRWTSDVAHELKTPLTSIRLVAETLQSRIDPQLKTWIDRLLGETIRLSTLVQDLLELGRLDLQSASALQVSHVDLVTQLRQAWQSLEPQAQQTRQTLNYIGPESVWMWGDRSRLYRLFLNVLDNAVKHNPSDDCIDVSMELMGDRLCVELVDGGPGFPPEALETIFERFYRANEARNRTDAGGTGLGLAIVKQIVEVHGGTIRADNYSDVGGARLRIEFSPEYLRPLARARAGP